MSLSGDLGIGGRGLEAVQLYVTAEDFKVVDNDIGNVRIESALEIGGTLAAPRIGGYLGVATGDVNLDEMMALVGTSAYPTEPIKDQVAIDETAEPASSGPIGALSIDVSLTIPNDLVVKASSLQAPGAPIGLGALNLTLGGDIRAQKDPGARLRLVGTVNTIRGNYDFQGRRFEILRDGPVQFVGAEELNPLLDLRTRRLIQGVEARVNVRGTLKQPEIELSSTPPLEQADILSLIVFNQPVNQLGEGDQISLAQRAQGMAAGAIAGAARPIARPRAEPRYVRDPGGAGNRRRRPDRHRPAGRPEHVRESGAGHRRAGTTNFIFEYQLTEWLRLQTNVLQGLEHASRCSSACRALFRYELAEWLRLQTNVVEGNATNPSLFRRAQSTGGDLIFFFSF